MALPNQRQKNDVARRVRLPELVALLAVIFFVTAISPACAQAPTAAPSVAGANAQATVTPAEAGQALDVLQDASRRDALIQTLQTIAKTSTPQPSPPLTPSVARPSGWATLCFVFHGWSFALDIAAAGLGWPRRHLHPRQPTPPS